MADPERGLWKGLNFKELHQLLKSNLISPAYGLTLDKDETFINKNCFVLLLYRGICRFCAIFGRFGDMAAFDLLGPAFDGHGSPPMVNMYMCTATEFKDVICTDYFQKVHANSTLQRQVISQIQTKRSRVGVDAA